jgi:hypothetical protein
MDSGGSRCWCWRSLDLCYARLCEKRKTLLGADTTRCPTCRAPFTDRDCEHLYFMDRVLKATLRDNMGKCP